MATGWIVRRNRKQTVPLPLEKLIRLAKAGKVLPGDLIRREDEQTWRAAWTMSALFDLPAAADHPVNAEAPHPAVDAPEGEILSVSVAASVLLDSSVTLSPDAERVPTAAPTPSAEPIDLPKESSGFPFSGASMLRHWFQVGTEFASRQRIAIAIVLLILSAFYAAPAFYRSHQTDTVLTTDRDNPLDQAQALTGTIEQPQNATHLPDLQPVLNGLEQLHATTGVGSPDGLVFSDYQQLMDTLAARHNLFKQRAASQPAAQTNAIAIMLIDRTCRFYSDAGDAWQRDTNQQQSSNGDGHVDTVRPDMIEARLAWAFADSAYQRLLATLDGRGDSFVCPVCHGTKRLTCPLCTGSGECFDHDACKGTGQITCPTCGGNGLDKTSEDDHLQANVPTAVLRKPCPTCGGKGQIICPSCVGTGRCQWCKGLKTLPCAACAE